MPGPYDDWVPQYTAENMPPIPGPASIPVQGGSLGRFSSGVPGQRPFDSTLESAMAATQASYNDPQLKDAWEKIKIAGLTPNFPFATAVRPLVGSAGEQLSSTDQIEIDPRFAYSTGVLLHELTHRAQDLMSDYDRRSYAAKVVTYFDTYFEGSLSLWVREHIGRDPIHIINTLATVLGNWLDRPELYNSMAGTGAWEAGSALLREILNPNLGSTMEGYYQGFRGTPFEGWQPPSTPVQRRDPRLNPMFTKFSEEDQQASIDQYNAEMGN